MGGLVIVQYQMQTVPSSGLSNELPPSYTQAELAKRFNVTARTIRDNLKKGTVDKANKFCEKRKDYYWRWSEQDGKFYPQHDPFKED